MQLLFWSGKSGKIASRSGYSVWIGGMIAAMTVWTLASGQPLAAQTRQPATSATSYEWKLPPWMPPPPDPPTNPTTAAKVELGRHLFYDGRLAADSLRSCASCHQQERSFSDGAPFSWGVTGALTARNTMALANVGYAPTLTWANPMMVDLSLQARSPLFGTHPIEMGMAGQEDALIAGLAEVPIYRKLFREVYPDDDGKITVNRITAAIAAFERTLVSATSPYDAYRFGGDASAISASAKRGSRT